jgi:hypothetical protein
MMDDKPKLDIVQCICKEMTIAPHNHTTAVHDCLIQPRWSGSAVPLMRFHWLESCQQLQYSQLSTVTAQINQVTIPLEETLVLGIAQIELNGPKLRLHRQSLRHPHLYQ